MSNGVEDSWSGKWCKEKLDKGDSIKLVSIIGTNLLSVTSVKGKGFCIATMSLAKIDLEDVKNVIGNNEVDFLLNVKKEPYITQSAIEFAKKNGFSIGGLSDVYRGVGDGELSTYVNPEIKFILRGLQQHNKVSNVLRLDNRRFKIERTGLATVIVLANNDYDITAESIRNSVEKFPEFDAIVKSNPNGRITSNGLSVAASCGIKVFKWGELLGQLNKQWI